jgi:hypothetical protein
MTASEVAQPLQHKEINTTLTQPIEQDAKAIETAVKTSTVEHGYEVMTAALNQFRSQHNAAELKQYWTGVSEKLAQDKLFPQANDVLDCKSEPSYLNALSEVWAQHEIGGVSRDDLNKIGLAITARTSPDSLENISSDPAVLKNADLIAPAMSQAILQDHDCRGQDNGTQVEYGQVGWESTSDNLHNLDTAIAGEPRRDVITQLLKKGPDGKSLFDKLAVDAPWSLPFSEGWDKDITKTQLTDALTTIGLTTIGLHKESFTPTEENLIGRLYKGWPEPHQPPGFTEPYIAAGHKSLIVSYSTINLHSLAEAGGYRSVGSMLANIPGSDTHAP